MSDKIIYSSRPDVFVMVAMVIGVNGRLCIVVSPVLYGSFWYNDCVTFLITVFQIYSWIVSNDYE